MQTITIRGHSDDIVSISGDIREEFNPPYNSDDQSILTFSDGTLLGVKYDDEGIWRIKKIHSGSAQFSKTEGDDPDGNYSDKVTLVGEISWVAFGTEYKKR